MLFELAFETVRPGALPSLIDTFERTVCTSGPEFGVLNGAWTTEIGTLNRFVSLWRYEDAAHRNRAQALRESDNSWSSYRASVQAVLAARSQRTLTPLLPGKERGDGYRLYELRTYDVLPGRLSEYIGYMREAIEDREMRSPNFGFWSLAEGNPDKFLHLWAYRDFNDRLEIRRAALSDPSWQTYLAGALPIVRRQRSFLMLPTAFSPLR